MFIDTKEKNSLRSFPKSLGYSVKFMYVNKETLQPKFSFVSDFKAFDDDQEFEEDSADSQSMMHHTKFTVDEFVSDDQELMKEF